MCTCSILLHCFCVFCLYAYTFTRNTILFSSGNVYAGAASSSILRASKRAPTCLRGFLLGSPMVTGSFLVIVSGASVFRGLVAGWGLRRCSFPRRRELLFGVSLKCREVTVCALEIGCRAWLPDVWPRPEGCCDVFGRVRVGAWVLVAVEGTGECFFEFGVYAGVLYPPDRESYYILGFLLRVEEEVLVCGC